MSYLVDNSTLTYQTTWAIEEGEEGYIVSGSTANLQVEDGDSFIYRLGIDLIYVNPTKFSAIEFKVKGVFGNTIGIYMNNTTYYGQILFTTFVSNGDFQTLYIPITDYKSHIYTNQQETAQEFKLGVWYEGNGHESEIIEMDYAFLINKEGATATENYVDSKTFLDPVDTPNSYVGQYGKFVAVKNDETGLEFVSGSGTSGTSGESGTSGTSGESGTSGLSATGNTYSGFTYDNDTETLSVPHISLSGVVTSSSFYAATSSGGPTDTLFTIINGIIVTNPS